MAAIRFTKYCPSFSSTTISPRYRFSYERIPIIKLSVGIMGSIEEGAYPRNNTKRKRRNALKLHKKGILRSRIVFFSHLHLVFLPQCM